MRPGGWHHTAETKKKLSAHQTPERRAKQSAMMKGNVIHLGLHDSEGTRQKKSIAKRGPSNNNWKGGKKLSSYGYVLIWKPGHPRADSHSYIFEHVLIAERFLGRSLKSGETVHHINGIKNDNRSENLKIFGSLGEHTSFHHKKGGLNDRIKH